MRILNATQMRNADQITVDEIGIPSRVLMESAGRAVVANLESLFSDLASRSVAIICGKGSNGGDALVVARLLHDLDIDVSVFLIGQVADVAGDARANLEAFGRLGGTVVEIDNEQAWDLHVSEVSTCDLVVDGLFGTGLRGPLRGMLETVIADINGSGLPILSIDLPSGLDANTHDIIGPAIRATLTVGLAAPKIPLVLPPGEALAGDLVIADIGIPNSVIARVEGPDTRLVTEAELAPVIQPRPAETHKGEVGRVVIVAGSPGKTGAAYLAGIAALRSGAGLVTVATPATCQSTIACLAPEYLTAGLPEDTGQLGDDALAVVASIQSDVVAIGPGLGTDPATGAFIRELVARRTGPVVLDADGLNAFADDPEALQGREGLELVITPHPGEMARLTGTTTEEVQANRIEIARTFASTHRVTVVLKGHRTLIATPDGTVWVNMTGNPGMATGGTGDVLTGMIAAWIAQLLDTEPACTLAVYLHGLAGDLAEANESEVSLIARDLVDRIGDAVLDLTADPQPSD